MAATEFPEGITVGPDPETRLSLNGFDEYFPSDVDLGTMATGEVRTLVFNDILTAAQGARIIASPCNPSFFEFLTIKHAWVSDLNQVSVIIKNDSDSEQTPALSDQWQLTIISTAAL
ncbi:MAG: hypothetical protein V4440_05495 [Pseudomonadota bacterium]